MCIRDSSMSYDQGGEQHSPMALAESTVAQAQQAGLPSGTICLGLPFYGRSARGEWMSYEDILQHNSPLDPAADHLRGWGFNGVRTIEDKTAVAVSAGLGGVMIWEVGQDCRLEEVVHGSKAHVVTCVDGSEGSLLVAIARTMERLNATLPRFPHHGSDGVCQEL
eukprot:TRINITY_DN19532_c0_g1_i2.p2 TRINITY_DN19532_c0_g1~~TRINITY_DN19532_c0_g1_i2.p2  ORF type:complete len:165 (+),score=36.33 TRINITY_DN19532_c0_g1_i2:181-675(+)